MWFDWPNGITTPVAPFLSEFLLVKHKQWQPWRKPLKSGTFISNFGRKKTFHSYNWKFTGRFRFSHNFIAEYWAYCVCLPLFKKLKIALNLVAQSSSIDSNTDLIARAWLVFAVNTQPKIVIFLWVHLQGKLTGWVKVNS